MLVENEDSDSMRLKIKVFNGKFENCSHGAKLTYDSNEYNANRVRQQFGLEENDTAVVFTLKCLPNATQEDLTDFSDFIKVLVKTSGLLEEADAPISAVTPSIIDGMTYGEKIFCVTCPLKAELSGMSAGVIQAAGVNNVEFEIKADEMNKSGYFSINIDISRNCIELAQEMAGLPPELASFAQMYNEADMTFKFRDWAHLVDNPILNELIPHWMADECKAVLTGSGIDQLLQKFATQLVQELVVKEHNSTFAPFFTKALACFQEVEGIQFIVGNSVFKCDITAKDLIQKFSVPIPDSEGADKIDPANYPGTFTSPEHTHELTLLDKLYGGMGFVCEKCTEYGAGHAYHCDTCQYDLHPKCALDQ